MTVKVSKPPLNLREELSALNKPTGIAGEAMLRAKTVADQQALINHNGRHTGTTTVDGLVVGNGGIQVGGTGSANTLDFYEEGTWTPTAYGSGATGATTYGQQYGSYTKIGNTVHATFYMGVSGMTGTGSIRIGGLPFNSASGSQYLTTGSCMTDALTWGTSKTMLVPYIQGSVNYIDLYGSRGDAGAWGNTPVDASWTIIASITYTAV